MFCSIWIRKNLAQGQRIVLIIQVKEGQLHRLIFDEFPFFVLVFRPLNLDRVIANKRPFCFFTMVEGQILWLFGFLIGS